jgi:hypothetical protein
VFSDFAISSFCGTVKATQNVIETLSDLHSISFGKTANVVQNVIDTHSD